MATEKGNFDHGRDTGDGFATVEKPPKRVKKGTAADVAVTERSVSSVRIKTPHGLTFNPVKQAHAAANQLWLADPTMVIVPLLEKPEAAPVASIDEFPKGETVFKKIFKVAGEEKVPGKRACRVACCSTEASTKVKDAKRGDNNLLAWLKEHKVVIEPANLDLGEVKKLGSLLFRHPSCANRTQRLTLAHAHGPLSSRRTRKPCDMPGAPFPW
jgi:hypothetical protein